MAPPSLPYEMHEKLNPCSDLLCKNATLLPVFWWKYKCQPKVTDVAQPKCPILHHLASEPHQSVDALDNMISKRGQPRNGPTHPRGKGRKGDTHTTQNPFSPFFPSPPSAPLWSAPTCCDILPWCLPFTHGQCHIADRSSRSKALSYISGSFYLPLLL